MLTAYHGQKMIRRAVSLLSPPNIPPDDLLPVVNLTIYPALHIGKIQNPIGL
jgi:hypothetical protein